MNAVWTVLIDALPVISLAAGIALLPLLSDDPPGGSRR